MTVPEKIACRFFGGPWDGRTVMREDAPFRLIVPVPGETAWRPEGLVEVVPQQDVMYQRRRGSDPVRTGTADYGVAGE